MSAIRFLDQISAGDVDVVGGKGLNLAVLQQAQLPVPPAFCVVSAMHRAARQAAGSDQAVKITSELSAQILAAYRQLGRGAVAVRSSAVAEDGSEASFAGQQETYLGITGEEAVVDAVLRCWKSVDADRARAYRRQQNISDDAVAMSVVVQRLIDADAAGVLFTRDPSDAAGQQMLVESAWGLGESVVSGRVTPDRFHLEFDTGRVLDRHISNKPILQNAAGIQTLPEDKQTQPSLTDEQLAALAELGRRVEAYYREPRDIEWCIGEGKLWLLQARPITVAGAAEREQVRREEIASLRALTEPGGTAWSKYNLAEILPEPMPLTWGIVRSFMAGQGGFGLMYRDLGYDPDPALNEIGYFDLVCGRPYVNLSREPNWHFAGFPYGHKLADLRKDPAKALYPQPVVDPARVTGKFYFRLPGYLWKMLRVSRRMAKQGRELPNRLRREVFPALAQEVAAERAVAYSALTPEQLLARLAQWRVRVLNEFARTALQPAMFTGVILAKLEAAFKPTLGGAAAAAEVRQLLIGIHPDPEADLPAALESLAEGKLSTDEFLLAHGHRGSHEMELAHPRWLEAPETLPKSGSLARHEHAHTLEGAAPAHERLENLLVKSKLPGSQRKQLTAEFDNLRTFLALRETSKHYFMLGYGVLRRILIELAPRFNLHDGIFYLTPEELPRLLAGENFAGLIRQRRERRKLALSLEVPQVLFSDDLEAIGRPVVIDGAAELVGTAISAGAAEGPALVLTEPAPCADIADGFILVCPSTDPAWVPLFLRAKGLVMESGGMLSHGAIVAREFGLPGVAALANAVARIKTGHRLRVVVNCGKVDLFE